MDDLFDHTEFIHPIQDMRSKTVVTACRRGVIFPERTGGIRHFGEETVNIFFELFGFAKKIKIKSCTNKPSPVGEGGSRKADG